MEGDPSARGRRLQRALRAGPWVIGRQKKPGDSGKGGKSTNGKGKGGKDAAPPKRTFMVRFPDGTQSEHCTPSASAASHQGPFFTYVASFTDVTTHLVDKSVFDINVAETPKFAGYMILDTACQRSCCGESWFLAHCELLKGYRMKIKYHPATDTFQFGAGGLQKSKFKAYIPVRFTGQDAPGLLLGASVLEADVPLLASNFLMESLGCIIDLVKQQVFVTAPLLKVNGHLVVSIAEHQKQDHQSPVWARLSRDVNWEDPPPELIASPEVMLDQKVETAACLVNRPALHGPTTSSGVASSMENGPHQGYADRVPHLQGHEPADEARLCDKGVANASRDDGEARGACQGHGTTSQASAPSHMHSPFVQEVRQPPRKVQPVPEVSTQAALGRGTRRRGTVGKLVRVCCCLAFNDATVRGNLQGKGQRQGAHGQYGSSDLYTGVMDQPFAFTASDSESEQDLRQEERGDRLGGRGSERLQADIHGGNGPGHPGGHELPLGMKKGQRQKLRTEMRQAGHQLQAEFDVMSQSSRARTTPPSQVDLLETFAGKAMITEHAGEFNLTTMVPVDYSTSFDLFQEEDQEAVTRAISRYRPLFLVQGIDCRDWCLLQDNTNYVRRKVELQKRRRKARKLATKWAKCQIDGRFFLIENPVTSRLWQEPDIKELENMDGVMSTVCHSGAYGATNSKGEMIRKGFRFMSNCPELLNRLQRKLDPEQLQQCVPLQTTLSQHYPHEMVMEILAGMKEAVLRLQPERLQRQAQVYVMSEVNKNPQDWTYVLDEAAKMFSTSTAKTYIVPPNDKLMETIKKNVPWKIEKVQLAATPAIFRMPNNFAYTHRGAVLRHSDKEIAFRTSAT